VLCDVAKPLLRTAELGGITEWGRVCHEIDRTFI
jgi:hypothetical protein